jgi:hypothetical protein
MKKLETMYNKATICRTANTLIKEGHNRSDAFKLAWQLAKVMESPVAGVSFGKRPLALERLTFYRKEDISITLEREAHNPYDASAVQVWASVTGKGCYCIGYIPANLSKFLSPLLTTVTATMKIIVGGYGLNYGMRLQLAV